VLLLPMAVIGSGGLVTRVTALTRKRRAAMLRLLWRMRLTVTTVTRTTTELLAMMMIRR